MENGFFADIPRLQEHSQQLHFQERIAAELADNLEVLRRVTLETGEYRYNLLVSQANDLERFFHNMGNTIEDASCELIQLSQAISLILQESTYLARRLANG